MLPARRPALPLARRFELAAAVALLAAVLCGAFAGPPRAAAEPVEITAGAGVDWGLKESWRRYIGPETTYLNDGVTRNPDGTFHFPLEGGSYDSQTGTTDLRLRGSVHFQGHCEGTPPPSGTPWPAGACMLDLTVAALRVQLDSDATRLQATVNGVAMPFADLDLDAATLAVAGGTTIWSEIPTYITPEGAAVFTYSPGQLLDPLSFSYEGPGGRPAVVADTPAATPRYESLAQVAVPEGQRVGALVSGGGAVHAIAGGGALATGLDPTTLATLGSTTSATLGSAYTPNNGLATTLDPATGTLLYSTATSAGSFRAVQWTGTSYGTPIDLFTGYTPSLISAAWDAANQRVVVSTNVPGGAALFAATRSEEAWTSKRFPYPYAIDSTHQRVENLIATTDGTVIGTRTNNTATVVGVPATDGEAFGLTEIAGTTGYKLSAAGGDDVAYLAQASANGRVLELRRGADGWAVAGDPIPTGLTPLQLRADPVDGTLYVFDTNSRKVAVVRGGAVRATVTVPGTEPFGQNAALGLGSRFAVGPDRTFYVADGANVVALRQTGISPAILEDPQDTTVRLGREDTAASASFAVATSGMPAPDVQWQTHLPGRPWTDVAGATEATLAVTATRADDGRAYRAQVDNEVGRLHSAPATLTVAHPPVIAQQPVDVAVAVGADAVFTARATGSPAPQLSWQRRIGGFWQAIDPEDGDVEVYDEGAVLVVKGANSAQDGGELRLRATNAEGVTFSRAVRISVVEPVVEPVTFGSGSFEWGFANRWRCYVTGTVAQGGIELSGGVTRVPGTEATGALCPGAGEASQALSFPVRGGKYDPATGSLEVKLNGVVRFWGHVLAGVPVLDTTFSDLRLIATGDQGILYADTTGATMDDPTPVTRDNVPLVTVDLSGSGPAPHGEVGLDWEGAATQLTAAGAEVFGAYPEAEPFDPIAMGLLFGTPQPDPAPETQPTPVLPDPLPVPGPTGPAARIKAAKANQSLGSNRIARLGTLACPSQAPCKVVAPKRVRTKVAGRSFGVRVLAPQWIGAGKSAALRVKLPQAAANRLDAGPRRKATIAVEVSVLANGNTASQRLRVVVRG